MFSINIRENSPARGFADTRFDLLSYFELLLVNIVLDQTFYGWSWILVTQISKIKITMTEI